MSLMNTVRFRNLGIVRGRGAKLFDTEGKEYIDFFTDVGTASLGYGSQQLDFAISRIARGGIVHSPILFQHEERDSAADRICHDTQMDKAFFCNSGAESVEAAIKIARKHYWDGKGKEDGGHPIIWCEAGGFHGRTLAGVAAGDGPWYHRSGFEPLPPGFQHFKRWREVHKNAAAVMLSPIFGNNDVRPVFGCKTWDEAVEELRALRKFCDENDIALIFDEVQTGSGRTGAMTYGQRIGVRPDILTLGKGVAMGAPVGITLARGKFAEVFTPGTHFSTFGGNPLCCEFLHEMLDWLNDEAAPLLPTGQLIERVERQGAHIVKVLQEQPQIAGVRNMGMLVAVDAKVDTLELARVCEERGLLLGAFRHGPGPLKITPPLNISGDELDQGLKILVDALGEV